jgi:RNA polymerase sporulation-specific sigma factor
MAREADGVQGKVEICGVNTAKLKVLKNEETMALLRRSKAGDAEARRLLIEGNLRLVLSVIQKFSGRGENVDDLFQVGCVGLIKAHRQLRHQPAGTLFHLRRAHDHRRDPPVPAGQQAPSGSAAACGTRPTGCCRPEGPADGRRDSARADGGADREGAGHSAGGGGVRAWTRWWIPVSLYEPVYSDGTGEAVCVMDQVSDSRKTRTRAGSTSIALKEARRRPGAAREKRILALRFCEGKTQMEVSGEVGISQAQVSRLEKGAISAIRKNL